MAAPCGKGAHAGADPAPSKAMDFHGRRGAQQGGAWGVPSEQWAFIPQLTAANASLLSRKATVTRGLAPGYKGA